MLQRKASKPGEGLGKTTGWIHRATLLARGVKMIPAVSYEKIDDEGLHVTIGGERQLLAVDQVVICAGQSAPRAGGFAARGGENGASHRRLRRGGGAGCAPGDCPWH